MMIVLDPDRNCDKLPHTEWLKNNLCLLSSILKSDIQNGLEEGSRRESVSLAFPSFRGSPHSLFLVPWLTLISASKVISPQILPPPSFP